MLSRNFRLQKVGNIDWLERNYDFSKVAFYIDELVVLDVSRGERDRAAFLQTLSRIAAGCFAPIAAGGGVDDAGYAKQLLRAGADKVLVNSALFHNPDAVGRIATASGRQCVVGSVDLKRDAEGKWRVFIHNGGTMLELPAAEALNVVSRDLIGELYLNSIERDGTGQGYDFSTFDALPEDCDVPIILAGGVGNAKHFAEGLAHPRVDAVATAHLFNFVGDGLKQARASLQELGLDLARWQDIEKVDLFRMGEEVAG